VPDSERESCWEDLTYGDLILNGIYTKLLYKTVLIEADDVAESVDVAGIAIFPQIASQQLGIVPMSAYAVRTVEGSRLQMKQSKLSENFFHLTHWATTTIIGKLCWLQSIIATDSNKSPFDHIDIPAKYEAQGSTKSKVID